jgi:hypothetical protein
MKYLSIHNFIFIYFIWSIIYWVSTGDTTKLPDNQKTLVWLRVSSNLLAYGSLFYFGIFAYSKTYNSLDLFSLQFFTIYCGFKFVFFSLLLNKDLPTYTNWLNSKILVICLTLSIIVFTLAFNLIRYDNFFPKRLS